MKIKILNTLCLSMMLFSFALTAQSFGEAAKATSDTVKAGSEDSDQKISPLFLERWNRVQMLVRKPAHEIQQTRTSSGVRGEEGKEGLEDQFYLKEGGRGPGRLELNNAILQLQEMISEHEFLMAACYEQLGDNQKAQAMYKALAKVYPKTQHGKLAQELLDDIAPQK